MLEKEKKYDKKLEYVLLTMTDILNYSNSLLKDSYRMLFTAISEEFSFVNRSKFLRKTQVAFFKLSIIELGKLFGKPRNNHFSFYKIESSFPTAYQSSILTMSYLEDNEVIKNIKLLEELRDTHFAHTDFDLEFKNEKGKRNIYEIEFYFKDAFFLINIAELIITELYVTLNVKKCSTLINKENDADIFLTNQIGLLNKIGKTIIQKSRSYNLFNKVKVLCNDLY